MKIAKETLVAFAAASCGAALVDAASVAAVTKDRRLSPEDIARSTASVAFVTSASVGMLGVALGGWSRPNSYARGMVWAGALGLVGVGATFLRTAQPSRS